MEALESRTLLSRSWFVAPWGNDATAGTLSQPFRTIQRAATLANWGDTVVIEGGTYHETVHPAHSGVTFEAYNGQKVTVSGADPIYNWSHYSGNIYQAWMPWDLGEGNNQVFVNGQMINEARWPNTSLDPSHPTLAHVQKYWGGTIYDSSLWQPNGYWNGAIIHITPGQGWVSYTGTVTSSGPGWIHVSLPPLSSNEQPTAGNAYYLFGKFQALDAPGEWYRDLSSGRLYVWTPNSSSPAYDDIEVKHRQYAFDLSGDSSIKLEGINIFAATIKTDGGSTNLTIDHLNAAYLSQFGAIYNGWSPPYTSGIMLMGSGSILENSTIADSAGDGVYIGASNVRVTGNTIHDVDYSATDAAAVRDYGSGTLIDHNTIYNAGRSGITHRAGNVQILYNTIHDVALQTTDAGGTYTASTNGQGSVIAYNLIYNVTSGGYGANAIFLDNNSSNYVVHDNTTWNVNSAVKLNYSSYNEQIYSNKLGANWYSLARSGYGYNWWGSVIDYNVFYASVQVGTGVSMKGNVNTSGSPAPTSLPTPPPPTSTVTSASGSSRFNAGSVIQAEDYTAEKGVTWATTVVGSFDNGDWVEYAGVNFGSGYGTFELNLAVTSSFAGQDIQIRIDTANGQVIGTLVPKSTGSWSTYTLQTTGATRVTGIHNLYLVGVGGGGIANLDWFKFL